MGTRALLGFHSQTRKMMSEIWRTWLAFRKFNRSFLNYIYDLDRYCKRTISEINSYLMNENDYLDNTGVEPVNIGETKR